VVGFFEEADKLEVEIVGAVFTHRHFDHTYVLLYAMYTYSVYIYIHIYIHIYIYIYIYIRHCVRR
jgi:hypothetical protein